MRKTDLIFKLKCFWHDYGVWVVSVATVLGMAFLAGISESYSYDLETTERTSKVKCGSTLTVYELLEKEYKEKPVAIAINDVQEVLVWFTNQERTTMTIVIDYPAGFSCMIMSAECPNGECYIPSAIGSVM